MEKEAEERRERMLRDIAEAEKAEKLRQEELLKAQPPTPAKYVPPRGGAGGIRDFERGSSGRPPATDRNINDWGRVPSARVEMASGGTPWRGGGGGGSSNDAVRDGGGRDVRESEVVRESNRDGDKDVGRFPTRDGGGRDARDSGLRSRDSGRDFGPRDGGGRDVREGGGRDNFVSRDGGRERTKDNKDTEDQWRR